jgi:hypothetical protein
MRKSAIAALAALMLGGCMSTLEDIYDDRGREECERETRPNERGECLDRHEQNRREH